jgi:two-component system NtrC family sensor kinase
VLAILALATIVPTAVVGGLAIRRARRDVETEVVRGSLGLIRSLGSAIDAVLQDGRRTLTLAAASWADEPAAAERLTRRLIREVPLLARLAFLSADGSFVAGDPEIAGRPFDRRDSYGGTLGDVWRNAEGKPAALLVVQARGRTGQLHGFAIAELDLGFLDEMLAQARLGSGARLHVVDASGEPLTGSSALPPEAVLAALAEAEEGSLETAGDLVVYRNLASLQTVRGVSWAVLLVQPTRDAFALARVMTRDTLIAGGLVLALALGLGLLFASALTRPLMRLAERVGRIGKGPPPPADEALSRAPGEIGVLARRFDEMALRVEERERLQVALARGAKLATVGALAAGVAHEINNPLTTILGYTSLLVEDAGDGPVKAKLELVTAEARRVQGIVRTLLDHARTEAGPLERRRVPLAELAKKVEALVGPSARQRRVTIAVSAEPAEAAGDPGRLEQVVVNLAQNAIQAMEGGGTLTLAARGAGDEAILSVRDTGPGIAAEHLGAIFEPFFTTKGPGVGTGLGLAIARQIVQDHGGRIEVESTPGLGSEFRVVLSAWREVP